MKAEIPIFILCGGFGTRLKEETEVRPKPMVPIGDHPILWHIMQLYSYHGFKKFVLCLGFKGEVIKDYFLNYHLMKNDCTVELKSNKVVVHSPLQETNWEVTMLDTGAVANTGARVARAIDKYLGGTEYFGVTYGDGLTDVNLNQELEYHLAHSKIGTVLGVNPPSRFGEIKVNGQKVIEFDEKPEFKEKWISGGFFFFHRNFRKYLSTDDSCILERHPLSRLAKEGELNLFKHAGFWACMDTQRDRDYLNELWSTGQAPWRQW